MQHKISSLLIGGGALALAVLGIPAATATAGAQAASHGHSAATTFTLTRTGANVKLVGTSAWVGTQPAGPTSTVAPATSHKLTKTVFQTAQRRVPDVGETPRATTAATGGGTGSGKHGTTGVHGKGHGKGHSNGATTPVPVSAATAHLASVAGNDAYAQGLLHPVYRTGAPTYPGIDVEPPDQGLCAGNGYVMEVNNMVVQMFSSSTMAPLSKNGMALENLFKAPEVFGGGTTGTYSVQGDPRCYYDPQTKHWFASQIWLTEAPFVGASTHPSATFGWAGEFVAVSTTSAPTGTWNVYFIPDQFNAQGVDHCSTTSNPCYGDQPLLGVNSNAVFISVNEYTLAGPYPVGGVATEYALSKADLINGVGSPIYWGHLGDTVAQPGATTCPFNTRTATGQSTQTICPWYSIVPASSDGSYITSTNGTFYAMSTGTFVTAGAHQIALWKFTNTAAVTNGGAHVTGTVAVATTVSFAEPPHSTVHGSYTASEALAAQKLGTHPLGTLWKTLTGVTPIKWPTGEGMIATNTDRVTTAAYDPADGSFWAALNTASPSQPTEAAIAWFKVTPNGAGNLVPGKVASGFLSAQGASIYFPAISFTNAGAGVMGYALSGTGYYPSTGYTPLNSKGPTASVRMARAGVGPQDGFSEYTPTYNRPRWGDYSTAVATGATFYFATEMINQRCSVKQYEATYTCGGTRDIEANFGTSVNKLT